MKRLIFIPLLIFSLTLSAQFTKSGGTFLKTGSGFMTAPTVPAEDLYCDKYDAVLAAYGTPPHDTIKIIQNALVYSLDTAGLLNRMDLLYIHCNNNSANALINWINPGTYNADLPEGNEPTFTANKGFTGASASQLRISTNFNPGSGTHNFTLNDCAIGVVTLDNLQEDGALYGTTSDFGTFIRFLPRNTSNQAQLFMNDGVGEARTHANSAAGHWIGSRTASDAGDIFYNGVALDFFYIEASDAIPNYELFIFNDRNSYSSNSVAIFYVMDGVDATDADEINDIIQAYLTSMGL
jgi:hypothetical protein